MQTFERSLDPNENFSLIQNLSKNPLKSVILFFNNGSLSFKINYVDNDDGNPIVRQSDKSFGNDLCFNICIPSYANKIEGEHIFWIVEIGGCHINFFVTTNHDGDYTLKILSKHDIWEVMDLSEFLVCSNSKTVENTYIEFALGKLAHTLQKEVHRAAITSSIDALKARGVTTTFASPQTLPTKQPEKNNPFVEYILTAFMALVIAFAVATIQIAHLPETITILGLLAVVGLSILTAKYLYSLWHK